MPNQLNINFLSTLSSHEKHGGRKKNVLTNYPLFILFIPLAFPFRAVNGFGCDFGDEKKNCDGFGHKQVSTYCIYEYAVNLRGPSFFPYMGFCFTFFDPFLSLSLTLFLSFDEYNTTKAFDPYYDYDIRR